jgi:glycosyltransferase involved in cell wall biosynthesis
MSQPSASGVDQSSPAFSVLIATYNQAGYVVDTLEAVAGQTCGDYEVVIVNDGSTDGTEMRVSGWVEEFCRAHPNRVVFTTIPNSGQSAAWEHGFAACLGRYVCLLDSDDRWLPNKLAAVSEAAAADPDAGMIVHPLYVVDAGGRRTGEVRPIRARLSEGDMREQVRRTARHIAPATTGVAIRADIFRALLPMPTRTFRADADFYLTFGASLLAPVHVIPEPLGEYRMHSEGHYLWRSTSREGIRTAIELQRVIAGHFGLEGVLPRNSYFARQVFALAKLEGGLSQQRSALRDLVRSTLDDPAFGRRERLLLVGFWTAALFAPRLLFERLWRWFQLRHTGYDKILEHRPAEER